MNYELMNNNKCYLYGTILSVPTFSHEMYGESFYDTMLFVPRLSSQADVIPITISDRLLSLHNVKVGDKIAVLGQYRSYNKQENEKSKLLLKMFVRDIISPLLDTSTNLIEISGYLCKEPIYRTTPFKREICDMLIAVNRAYKKSDYLPCIAWGRNARYAKSIEIGQKVFLTGRVQSREYQKHLEDGNISIRTAYEISITKLSLEPLATQIFDTSSINISPHLPLSINKLKMQNG